MWAKLMETKTGYGAQIWKELFNNCALSVRVVQGSAQDGPPMNSECELHVPWGKTHVALEILRKS
jgi:hypothetical protein